jgi:S1-C subfamily serine protease
MRWINEISAVDQSTVFDYPMARPYLPFEIVSGEDGKGTTYYVSAASGHVRIPSGVVVLGQSLDVNALTGDLHRDIIHAVNQARIQSVEQLRSTLRQLKSGDPLVLQIEPQGQLHSIGESLIRSITLRQVTRQVGRARVLPGRAD